MTRILVLLGSLELILLMGLGVWLGPGLNDVILPGVYVWDVSVGGLTPAQAEQRLMAELPLNRPQVVLLGPDGQRWDFTPADLGMSLDVAQTLARAEAVGRNSKGLEGMMDRVRLMRQGVRLAPVLLWDPETTQRVLWGVGESVGEMPVDAGISLAGGRAVLQPGKVGRRMIVTQTLELLVSPLTALEPVEVSLPMAEISPRIGNDQAQQALTIAQAMLAAPLELLLSDPQEGDPGPWVISPEMLAEMLDVRIDEQSVSVSLREDALAAYLSSLATVLYREPVDASFTLDVQTLALEITSPSRPGREVDVPATVTRINTMIQSGQHQIPLVVHEIPPAIPDTITAADLGIQELVAVGESYFTGSSSARDKNIRLGASRFDGVLVRPGETFSFNEHLGEVTAEAGYDESYVIIGDRTVPGVGGGICQVATTAFRAAFYGGYPIVERWPHAYRVGYYELGGFGPGFDATVYSPYVDFRFRNDTPYHILIHTEVDEVHARLRFLFYSTSDGRTVEQIGPEWGDPIPPGPPVYEYDPTLPAGTVVKVESAHDGIRATLGRIVRDAEGHVLYHDEFVSNFVPWPARYKFGPGYVPPEGVEVVGLPDGEGD